MGLSHNDNSYPHPGEKLKRYGCDRLSDNELLAIIIGDNQKEVGHKKTVDLSNALISHFGNLKRLGQASIAELASIPGIDYVIASRIKAAMELGRRPLVLQSTDRIEFSGPKTIYDFYHPRFSCLNREVFIAVLLDRKLKWISDIKIAEGSLFSCNINPRDTFSTIIRDNPASVVFLHNHPTGDPEPSAEDRELTSALCDVGEFLQIKVEDHIVIGHGCYYSFAEHGEIRSYPEKNNLIELQENSYINKLDIMPDLCCMHDLAFSLNGLDLEDY